MNDDMIVKIPPFKYDVTTNTLSQGLDWGVKMLNIPDTWKITRGENITILILDTGCPASEKDGKIKIHPDLKNNLLIDKCKSFVPYEDIYDYQGHSTACAGVISAEDNLIGLVGYAPSAKIITYKVLSKSGSGKIAWIENGLKEAINLKPDIISMSLGSPQGSYRLRKLIEKLDSMNIPIICAAGNSGEDGGVEYPAKYKQSFAIGAFDKNHKIADFSARGDEIDFVFPGVDISTTWLNGGYTIISGTSFACPSCAGLVALILSKHRKQEQETGKNDCKTTLQIYEHLKKYAINPEDETSKNKNWGWGYVDVNKMFLIQEQKIKMHKKQNSLWTKIKKFFGIKK